MNSVPTIESFQPSPLPRLYPTQAQQQQTRMTTKRADGTVLGSATTAEPSPSDTSESNRLVTGTITVVAKDTHYAVVSKPPSVVCHYSEWTGKTSPGKKKKKKSTSMANTDNTKEDDDDDVEIPVLQRVREALQRPINLVHRLDRGASGCLLCTYLGDGESTAVMQNLMQREPTEGADDDVDKNDGTKTRKTYVALVRGSGVLKDRDMKQEGWFMVDRAIKDEKGQEKEARTWFRFVAGQEGDKRAALVLARPVTGRWHQIRRHLNGLSHPILGDSTHGNSRTNREWRGERGLPGARLCLHLLELKLPADPTYCPDGVHALCPLPDDMMRLLREHMPDVLREARQTLQDEEGLSLETPLSDPIVLDYAVPVSS